MKNFISQYHLKIGFSIAVLFPGIFLFSKSFADPFHIFIQFVSIFSFLFLQWIIVFSLVDFRSYHHRRVKKPIPNRPVRIVLTFIISVALYLAIGFSSYDYTGSLLSQISGDQIHSFRAWFFLCLRVMLENAAMLLIKYIADSNREKQQVKLENEVLKRENLNATHEILKQQVNPHFLFNSLNTLKALVKTHPEQSVHFITELSSVYRYMLQHQDKKEVPLREEIRFLESYLFLLRIRFGEAIRTRIDISPGFLDIPMPPNTLQMLMENAVKHNTLTIKNPLYISVFTENNYLVVHNNLQEKTVHDAPSQVGIHNINNRYLLLKGCRITVEKTTEYFRVLLPLNENI